MLQNAQQYVYYI